MEGIVIPPSTPIPASTPRVQVSTNEMQSRLKEHVASTVGTLFSVIYRIRLLLYCPDLYACTILGHCRSFSIVFHVQRIPPPTPSLGFGGSSQVNAGLEPDEFSQGPWLEMLQDLDMNGRPPDVCVCLQQQK